MDTLGTWALADELSHGDDHRQTSTQATVRRIDTDGTVWVRLAGATEDTPANGTVTVDAKAGDVVTATVEGGRLSITGNATSPSVGGSYVKQKVEPVADVANDAIAQAGRAKTAADAAEAAAGSAVTAANAATTAAGQATTAAQQATTAAGNAATAAATADAKAVAAAAAAATADGKAVQAAQAATRANTAANDALTQLSVVQDVAGTLQWISENCEFVATTDTTVQAGTVYFELVSGEYVPIAQPDEDADPSSEGWYVLDVRSAVSEYVMAHIALTSAGLWVLPSGFEYAATTDTSVVSGTAYYVRSGTSPDYVYTRVESPTDDPSAQGWYVRLTQFASDYKVLLSNSGMSIYDGSGTIVASYGSTVRIGKVGESHMELDYHSLQLIDKQGNIYFHVSDLRDANGEATLTETFKGDGTTTVFTVQFGVSAEVSATDSSDETNTASRSYNLYTFTRAPAIGATITIVYKTNNPRTKAYTFGQRASNTNNIGGNSVAEGYGITASGTESHAEGWYTTASGMNSHAEGFNTKATERESHAEGSNTTASGSASHAEGNKTVASGDKSHAQNHLTIAAKEAQTALGTYNEEDTSSTTTHPSGTTDYGTYAAIIGNGTSDSARSNALAVRWDGVTECRNENGDWGTIFNLIYPVGAIYMSVNSTSPQTLFGGTWERITGKFLLAATDNGNSGASQAAGNTGGEATHALTPAETATKNHSHTMAHTHTINHGHGNNISYTMADAGGHTHKIKYNNNAASGTARPVIDTNGASTQSKAGTDSAGSHKHTLTKSGSVSDYSGSSGASSAANTGGQTEANGSAHNNMPPYLSVYVWKRTA